MWAMSDAVPKVFQNFQKIYKWPPSVTSAGLQIDRWLRDGEAFSAGSMQWEVIATPGHTPACLTYRLDDWLFTGDAIMMPDGGVGRCDFPGGSASELYTSVWGRIYSLPDHYKIFVGHDYQPGGRPLRYQTTVGEERLENIHLKGSTSREDFVNFREARDKTLKDPRLLAESLDWNLRANQLVLT
jgi:glyoxylase-like metal-dependent hydrolase (beta-lactamase superfamily II)